MPSPQEEPDVEQGALASEIFTEWNFDESRLACASNYLAGKSLQKAEMSVRTYIASARVARQADVITKTRWQSINS